MMWWAIAFLEQRRLQIVLTALMVFIIGGFQVYRALDRTAPQSYVGMHIDDIPAQPYHYDNQERVNLQYYPIAFILGALAPSVVVLGPFAYWMFGRLIQRTATRFKVCEHCAETIKWDAKVCRYCGRGGAAEADEIEYLQEASAVGGHVAIGALDQRPRTRQRPSRRTLIAVAILGLVLIGSVGVLWVAVMEKFDPTGMTLDQVRAAGYKIEESGAPAPATTLPQGWTQQTAVSATPPAVNTATAAWMRQQMASPEPRQKMATPQQPGHSGANNETGYEKLVRIYGKDAVEAAYLGYPWVSQGDQLMAQLRGERDEQLKAVAQRAEAIVGSSTTYESGHWVDGIMSDGELIKLEDGSLWKVDGGDRIISALWLPTTEIVVCDGKLIDTDDNESVEVQRIR